MLERKALERGEFSHGEIPLAAGVDDACAGGGHCPRLRVRVLGRAVSHRRSLHIVIGPAVRDAVQSVLDGRPGLEVAIRRRIVGVSWRGIVG